MVQARLANEGLIAGLGHVRQEGQRGPVPLHPEDVRDQLLLRARDIREGAAERHHRLRTHIHEDLLNNRLHLGILLVEERLEELRHGVLAGGQQAVLGEVAPLELTGEQVDVPGDLVRRAGPIQATGLVEAFESRGRRLEIAPGIASHRFSDGGLEAAVLAARVEQVGERLRREIEREQLLADEVGGVVPRNQHIVDEVLEHLLGGLFLFRLGVHAGGRRPEHQHGCR